MRLVFFVKFLEEVLQIVFHALMLQSLLLSEQYFRAVRDVQYVGISMGLLSGHLLGEA